MKRKYLVAAAIIAISFGACTKEQLSDNYADPSKVDKTTVEQQFAGFLASHNDYVMYHYWNYFVVLQSTALHYTQAVGWQNAPGQYVPGAAAIGDRWNNFYNFVAQYKELVKVYNALSDADKTDKRIYMIAATIYYYDQTEKVVDLHGDIPWEAAGMLSSNNGDYQSSFAKYDAQADIYTKMLDDLKAFADELNTLTIPPATLPGFATQDYINLGKQDLWKKYCNSLRVRMLMRVSGATAFTSRSNTEMAAITGNPSAYPLVKTNADNIQVRVKDLSTPINSSDFYSGLIGWGSNDIAGKVMIDTMKHNADPRLRAMFQPGDSAAGVYNGLDQTLDATTQLTQINSSKLARYNYFVISKNQFLPGNLINAAEVNFFLAEYYLKSGNDASAKAAYEAGIKASIEYYFWLGSQNTNPITGSGSMPAATNDAEISNYLNSDGIKWNSAGSSDVRMNQIGIQKWINYSVLQPLESWAEIRRTNFPKLNFVADATNPQTLPPTRWVYPASESTFNSANYEAVKANDKLNTKLFWDVN